jgi:hypothetical protein
MRGEAPAHLSYSQERERERGRGAERDASLEFGNDPSAGSPTETLLRLLLPLNDPV